MTPPTARSFSLWHRLAPPLLLLSLCAALQAGGFEHALRYDRTLIAGGAPWRLLSGNLVHLGWGHLTMNGLGLLLVWLLLDAAYTLREWGAVVAAAALAVGTGLYWASPQVLWYVGLSGVLHGLLAAGAVARWRRARTLTLPLLLGLAAKLVWEQTQGAVPGSAGLAGGDVIVDAHLYGTLGGLLAALPLLLRRTRSPAH